MREKLAALREKAVEQIRAADSLDALSALRSSLMGKKGELTQILRHMGGLTAAERPALGQLANELRDQLEDALTAAAKGLRDAAYQRQLGEETLDVTLPGRRDEGGSRHPLCQTMDEVEDIFISMGFGVEEGFEVETDYYNFEAMNLPKNHPARDMQDSFYITDDILLRTHTSPTQTRVMEKMCPRTPVKVIIPGKVYRRDDDATHSPMFHQVEGLVIDRGIRFSDLKGTLLAFIRRFYGQEQEIRLRPSYFPFTEPSAEVDMRCVMCGGAGCRTCKGTGWLEILGSGMVHPKVLRMGGYDPALVTGFAFGVGVERLAMLKYGVDDLRLFFENDARFLRQF
ncbi:MAG: phenylalanine--tRNA ligase subunit alpha [Peptococcaceae bacterium]|jgi:phenylalanyl-tRNA synthetase alpha chain|nr:phenylalanine--tRNA ligase subunit alpha [Peptococcaceae bacterium]